MEIKDFNPRSREGSDISSPKIIRTISYFNPRSREGSDCEKSYYNSQLPDFNPRSREGSDGDSLRPESSDCKISIHAPARGAT